MSIFLDVMKEELERNLYKQDSFKRQINNLPKGYLSKCVIDGKVYIYRKERKGNKIISRYIGIPGDDKVKEAEHSRDLYIKMKSALKNLEVEEKRLRKAIKDYEKLWEWNAENLKSAERHIKSWPLLYKRI